MSVYKHKDLLASLLAPVIILGMLAIALFVSNPEPAAVMVAFLWLLVLQQKGYIVYAAPLFLGTGILFVAHPVFWTGFLMNTSLLLLATLPARKKVAGKWQIANKTGSFRRWLLPRGPGEDIGGSVGDASIHLLALAAIIVALYTFIL